MTKKNGNVVRITGANQGLGKEIGRQLGAHGYTRLLGARDEPSGRAAASEIAASGCEAHALRLEVTPADDIASVVRFVETTFGKLDVLVNNAGLSVEWDGKPTDADKIRRTLEVNRIAPFVMTDALIPLLARSADAGDQPFIHPWLDGHR